MNNFDALGYYKLLEVDYYTDESVLKNNYRTKAKFWHPDHNSDEKALENFQKIAVAYDMLKNNNTKIMYTLLSMVYTSKDFPDLQTIKIYKTDDGQENPFLRVLSLMKYSNKTYKLEKPVVSYNDAIKIINNITKNNILKGWINPIKNIKSLKFNRENINKNKEDNFKMLVHNSVAYYKQNKLDKAYISAKESLYYANLEQQNMVYNFLSILPQIQYIPQIWNFEYLKDIQLRFIKTIIAILICSLCLCAVFFKNTIFPKTEQYDKINYYQEVRFNSGSQTVDDMILSKVFNIPVDLYDDKMLFHITSDVDIMHGPSEDFDVLIKSYKNQTVRVTGYTPDEIWYRVMLDDGNMGFVKKQYLKKGIGNQIPEKSKIIKNNER